MFDVSDLELRPFGTFCGHSLTAVLVLPLLVPLGVKLEEAGAPGICSRQSAALLFSSLCKFEQITCTLQILNMLITEQFKVFCKLLSETL